MHEMSTLQMPTIVRFNGNSEAWELADRRLVESYLEGGFQLLLCNYRYVSESRLVLARCLVGSVNAVLGLGRHGGLGSAKLQRGISEQSGCGCWGKETKA